MTLQEFSNEFDVLYNNVMSNNAPGLDEYEKSVFLTKAQNEVIKNYFNPKGNKYQEGFDGSQKRQIDFSKLMMQYSSEGIKPSSDSFFYKVKGAYKILWPKDIFIIVNEVVDILYGDKVSDDLIENAKERRLQVIPIKFDEYTLVCSKPYKQPLKNQAWRIITSNDEINLIIGHNNFIDGEGYHIRYIRRPKPIILEDLGDGLTIDEESQHSDCELDKEIHHEILQRAVELAKICYSGAANDTIQAGQRSE